MEKMTKKWWINHYGHNGDLLDSTPFNTIKEATDELTMCIDILNPCLTERTKFNKINDTHYIANNNSELKIERSGDKILHIKTSWVALCANYTEHINTNKGFMVYLSLILPENVNSEEWKEYAKKYCNDKSFRNIEDARWLCMEYLPNYSISKIS